MDCVLFQDDVLIGNQVGIRQIDGQCGVIVAQVRAEQERWCVIHQELETRKIASVAIEQPVGSRRRRTDIAMIVAYHKRIVMLQRSPRPARGLRH